MNIEDIYREFPALMTDLEKAASDLLLDGSVYGSYVPTFVMTASESPLPDGFDRDRFLQRRPALGWNEAQIQQVQDAATPSQVHDFIVFNHVDGIMRRRLISPSGASTTQELCQILRNERASGIPAPIPDWYEFSNERYGPATGQKRRFGYKKCENRSCYKTEDLTTRFLRCAECQLATYCGRECQVGDWTNRHKKVCKVAKKKHDMTNKASHFLNMTNKASQFLNMFVDTHEGPIE